MPTKRLDEYREMTYTIDGNELHGIPDFECNFEPVIEELNKQFKCTCDPVGDYVRDTIMLDPPTITTECKLNKWLIYKLIGLYDWVLDNCPNKRVVHLAKYARKKKTRSKNFNRAIRLIAKLYAN